MTTLNRRAKELIAEVGESDGPTAVEKADLRAAVMARVGVAAVTGTAVGTKTLGANVASGAAKASAAAAWAKGLAVLGVVALAGAGYVGVSAISQPAKSTPLATHEQVSGQPAPSPAVPDPAPKVVADPGTPAVVSKAPAILSSRPAPRRQVADPDVEGETAGLARVLSTLREGGATEALASLDREDARYPHGALTEERAATRIDLLCALGRRSDARAAAGGFLRTYPHSVLAGRVTASCGAAAP